MRDWKRSLRVCGNMGSERKLTTDRSGYRQSASLQTRNSRLEGNKKVSKNNRAVDLKTALFTLGMALLETYMGILLTPLHRYEKYA